MNPLDVIWIDDEEIRPPGPKMVVCVQPFMGFFCRINSHDNWPPSVPLIRVPDHMFLQWDSFIQCRVLELDEYIVQESLRKRGVIGTVSTQLCQQLLDAFGGAGLSRMTRDAIRESLEPLA